VRAIAHTESVCRVTLAGEAAPVARLALTLAQSLGATIPCGTLAAEASAIAAGPRAGGAVTLPPRRLGAPDLPPGLSVDDAFAFIVAHLLDVILHYAPRALAGEAPEPVHQMRVAVRRLRSAFSLFKKHAACAELAEAKAAVKLLARLLGPPRDWDVFLAGTCAAVAAAVPDDPAVARLAVRARRRREAGYAALSEYLHSAEFRSLGLRLALLAAAQPWREMAAPEAPPEAATSAGTAQENASEDANLSDAADGAGMPPPLDLRRYAIKALHKRLRRVLAPGADIVGLPDADLHAIRLNGKRLRYAAEFFAPLFPGRETRRFLRRVTTLQERLGHLNDGAVASGLMAEIGQARGYVGGVVRGFVAAGGQDTRSHIGRSWKRFRKLEPFWE
jgi:CHAD domain-containing protein